MRTLLSLLILSLATVPGLHLSRGALLRGTGIASLAANFPFTAHALNSEPLDNEIVAGQAVAPNKLDVNNSPVADYMKYPGMYPTIGGKIATGGPYDSVKGIYAKLSSSEAAVAKQYAGSFIATKKDPLLDPMRGRDPYRGQFNEQKQRRD
mmetsp:Transcript_52719/g.138627  ORF Transcript_52719/g.138627 Transcript_52719/m.138627 type:complete len:151 (-) Transcript_52719:159-611(-)